jgi:hypothetical protein
MSSNSPQSHSSYYFNSPRCRFLSTSLWIYFDLGTSCRSRSNCSKSCGGNETPTIFCFIAIYDKIVILENYDVYPSVLPAKPKLLPRPCPQCGSETGGCQWVIINPKFYKRRTRPYAILRISHGYSKTERTKNNTRKKIVHNFQMGFHGIVKGTGERLSLDNIFDHVDYYDRDCLTLPFGANSFEYVKAHGWWGLVTEGAHFINKTGLKQCQKCDNYFKTLHKFHYPERYTGLFYYLLCESCYVIETKRITEWKHKLPVRLIEGRSRKLS